MHHQSMQTDDVIKMWHRVPVRYSIIVLYEKTLAFGFLSIANSHSLANFFFYWVWSANCRLR
jgi:hypothetical protein